MPEASRRYALPPMQIEQARPSEAAITFGVELTAKEGLAVAVLARGEAKASLEVTLTWKFDGPPEPASPAASPATDDSLDPSAQ